MEINPRFWDFQPVHAQAIPDARLQVCIFPSRPLSLHEKLLQWSFGVNLGKD